ncbi:MAG: hypothetical protein COB16_16370 [Rhodobacteraceae bacterium]|nr:MAG: hypothetical protein COB16_16370 [Paracoccaceae bacterium]
MSEPVTHAEIEDVLSSIRRLVSEDGRDSALAGVPAPVRKSPARLVLTPSFRVADVAPDTATKAAVAEETSSSQPEPQPDNTPDETAAIPNGAELKDGPDDGTEVGVSTSEGRIEIAAEGIADAAAVEPASHGDNTVLHLAEQNAPESDVTQSEDAPWRDPDATLFAAASVPDMLAEGGAEAAGEVKSAVSFAEKIAALEAAIGQVDEDWEPDGETGEDNSGTAVETLAWEDLEDETVEPEVSADDDVVETTPQAEAAPAFDPPETDMLDADQLAEQAVADEVLGGFAADETVMDEETLRELVADIVREELQGALGERITRNVRKLVRREIHRALAVQDLG